MQLSTWLHWKRILLQRFLFYQDIYQILCTFVEKKSAVYRAFLQCFQQQMIRIFFSDINECTQNITQCEANVICENNPGSYSCVCQIGFSGDGTTCIGYSKLLIKFNSYNLQTMKESDKLLTTFSLFCVQLKFIMDKVYQKNFLFINFVL